MIVKCIKNKVNDEGIWSKSSTPLEDLLIIGNYYVVYGVFFKEGSVFVEILFNERRLYTDTLPLELFEIFDRRLSKYFVLGQIGIKGMLLPFISFPEWASDRHYFEKLVDGDKESRIIFNYYRDILYLEYKHPDIKQSAILIQDNWVQCPICTEVWTPSYTLLEMCKCPNCHTVSLNPYVVKT